MEYITLMPDKTIYVLDNDPSRVEIFKEHFSNDELEVLHLNDLPQSSQDLISEKTLTTILDYQIIVNAEREEVVLFFKSLKNSNLVVYGVPENASRRLAFYELGARRVYDTSFPLEEICHSMKWFLHILSISESGQKGYSKGKLEDISLTTLINSLGKESRSGVLKIVTMHNSGKIYFYNGDIDDACVGTFQGQRALLHMLFWNRGTFAFNPVDQEKPLGKITLSNIGLILFGEHLRGRFIEQLEEIGLLFCTIRAINTGDLTVLRPDLDPVFIELLKKPHHLEEILENPVYTCYETVEKLISLKEDDFLIINEPVNGIVSTPIENLTLAPAGFEEVVLNPHEITQFKLNIDIDDQNSGKLIIIASPSAAKTEFIRQLTRSKNPVRKEKHVEVARLSLGGELDLMIYGMVMNEVAIETARKLSGGLIGYIFLVDMNDSDQFEYINYMINHLLGLHPVANVIAVTGLIKAVDIDSVQSEFVTSLPLNWQACDPDNVGSIRDVLLSLKPIPGPEEEEKEAEE